MEFYPRLKEALDVRWIDFTRPRPELIELLGEENQSCPVLVLRDGAESLGSLLPSQRAKGRWFVEGANEIACYLARLHGIAIPH